MYTEGIKANIKLAPEIYPGWKVMVWKDPIPGIPDGKFWRFLAADLPEAEYVIFRDADSRLNWKEKAAVDEWIASGHKAHLMQDHNDQSKYPILAGMWGIKGGIIKMRELMKGWTFTMQYGNDEMFLRDKVWPLIIKDHIKHGIKGQPWPHHRSCSGFIGQKHQANGVPLWQ